MSAKYDALLQDHSALNVKHNGQSEAFKKLTLDHDVVTKNLHDANIMRQEIEEERTKSEKNKDLLNQRYRDALIMIDQMKKDLERIQNRLTNSDKLNEELRIRQDSIQK